MKVLCIAAHPDDLEIGMGGLILANPDTDFYYLNFASCKEKIGQENILEERSKAVEALGFKEIVDVKDFVFRKLDKYTPEIRQILWDTYNELKPDMIFTHYPFDSHQDHATVGVQTMHVLRNMNVWCYEIIRSDSPEWCPNIYYGLTKAQILDKILALNHYKSQSGRSWFSSENIFSWNRMRGTQSGYLFAECFWSPRVKVKSLESF